MGNINFKLGVIIFAFFVFVVLVGWLPQEKKTSSDDFAVLKGPYLGQKPPALTPEIFAPGIISTEKKELASVFTPGGMEFYFCIGDYKKGYTIMFTKQENGIWTKPKVAPFSGIYSDVDMNISPDGKRIYFCSDRPSDTSVGELDIWYCERTEKGWSEPINMGAPVNSPGSDTYPCFTQNGGLYLGSDREGTRGGKDVYYTQLRNGNYIVPVRLGDAINSDFGEGDTYVDFDESFMIINSWGRPDTYGGGDLYISYKLKDGNWSKARNMGDKINSESIEFCPMLSPDGKYLFFTSGRTGNRDIYWVDAKIIEEFKPKELK